MAELTNEHWCSGMPGYRGRVSIATGPLSPRPLACQSIVVCGLGSTADNTMLLPTTPPLRRVTESAVGLNARVFTQCQTKATYWRAQS